MNDEKLCLQSSTVAISWYRNGIAWLHHGRLLWYRATMVDYWIMIKCMVLCVELQVISKISVDYNDQKSVKADQTKTVVP